MLPSSFLSARAYEHTWLSVVKITATENPSRFERTEEEEALKTKVVCWLVHTMGKKEKEEEEKSVILRAHFLEQHKGRGRRRVRIWWWLLLLLSYHVVMYYTFLFQPFPSSFLFFSIPFFWPEAVWDYFSSSPALCTPIDSNDYPFLQFQRAPTKGNTEEKALP